jgi:methylenetetrahydrofolate reductase (NADPH)
MEGFMDDAASIRAFGLDVVTRLCERLIEGGAPSLHFYTLNQSALSLEICRRLGLATR